MMNKYHKEILELYTSFTGNYSSKHNKNYIGSNKFSYSINTPSSRKLVKDWVKEHSDLSLSEYTDLLNSLSLGKSHNEFSVIGKLLEYYPSLRKELNPKLLDSWLNHAEGWAEVDTICQGNFTADEMISHWSDWNKLIENFTTSKNVHKRRASLVLLTGPVRHSLDNRLSDLAFSNIDKLKKENDILITKAISWLLRDLIKYHRQEVEIYLDKNLNTLPKIAIRETKNKLKSGRKSGK